VRPARAPRPAADAARRAPLYQDSTNSAERFLAHHAGATLQLRACHASLHEALKAINFSDRKVLEQYLGLCGFLGHDELKTAPTVQFGRSAIERGEFGLGLEAISQAVAADLARGGRWSDVRENGIELARIYAQAAQAIAWSPSAGGWSNTQTRIAYLVSSLGDDEPAARAAAAFARSVNYKQFRVGIYSTETFCRRDKQQFTGEAPPAAASAKRGAVTLARLKESKAGCWIAPTTAPAGADLAAAATALADQLVNDQTDVLIIDADPSDAIAGLLCYWNAARARLWIARRTPLFSTSLGTVAYLDATRLAQDEIWWQQQGIITASVLEGVDVEAPITEAPRRSAYGIPESAVILTTAAEDVARTITPPMIDAVAEALRKHPNAVYLIVGPGETSAIRRRFEAAGVAKRVGYAGRRRDLPGFLKVADIYLAEFPAASVAGVLQGMTMSLPPLVMAAGHDIETAGPAAQIAGGEATIAPGETAGYVERLSRLIRDGAYRQQQGKAARKRIEQLYRYEQTARSIEMACERLLDSATQTFSSSLEGEITIQTGAGPAGRKAA
jgi:hypothetical protein